MSERICVKCKGPLGERYDRFAVVTPHSAQTGFLYICEKCLVDGPGYYDDLFDVARSHGFNQRNH